MPAKRLPWIKFWPEAMDHEKWAALSGDLFKSWIKVWAKASQQPTRWRFASVDHAAEVCGRTPRVVRELVDRKLLDERPDGLWVHDWQQWQDRYPSDFEDSANTPPTLHPDPPNGAVKPPPRLPTHAGRREKGEERRKTGDVRRETGDEERPPPTAEPITRAHEERPSRSVVAKPTKGNDQVKALIDAVRALDPALAIHGDRGRVGQLLKRNPETNLQLVAEAYVAFHHGEWPGTNWLRQSGALWAAIEDVGGFATWRTREAERQTAEPEVEECPDCHQLVDQNGYGHKQERTEDPERAVAQPFTTCIRFWQAPARWRSPPEEPTSFEEVSPGIHLPRRRTASPTPAA